MFQNEMKTKIGSYLGFPGEPYGIEKSGRVLYVLEYLRRVEPFVGVLSRSLSFTRM